jgi:multidrug efflux system membrane fusion protein
LEATGTVESYSQVAVKSMVNGEVKKVHFTEGQDVAKGQILFTIDPRQSEAAIRKGEADLARIKAQLATARANAERYGRLVKDGIVTAEQYDSFRTQAESLEADYTAQQAQIEALRVQLSYCTIRSPISGRTGNLLIHAGNVVKANDTLSLVTINQIRPIYVAFSIPERELPRIRQYLGRGKMKVEARLQGDGGPPEIGEVTFLDNAVDAATATIKLKGTFANSKTRLWPGQFVSVRLTLSSLADAVVVPTQAVQTGQQGQYLFVVTGDSAELRPVKAGVAFEGVTVVEQGLKSGETVVTDGHMRVVPGGKVMVKQEPGAGRADTSAAATAPAGGAR